MPIDRRRFAKHLAAGAIAVAPASAARAGEPANEAKSEPQPAKAEPAELVLELVKQLYPRNLDDEKLGQIRAQIEQQMARSTVLGAFPLTNADEPAPVFAAWRADG
jgi:hypothetical protein